MKHDDEDTANEGTDQAIIATIVTNGDRVLLVRRQAGADAPIWAFPVGPQHSGETPEQASVRQVAEETGQAIVPDRVIGERLHPQNGRLMVYVAAHPADLAPPAATSSAQAPSLAWCTLADFDARVPPGIYPPVRDHLEHELTSAK